MKYNSIEKLVKSFPKEKKASERAIALMKLNSNGLFYDSKTFYDCWYEMIFKWFKYHKDYYLISKKKYEEMFGIDEII